MVVDEDTYLSVDTMFTMVHPSGTEGMATGKGERRAEIGGGEQIGT